MRVKYPRTPHLPWSVSKTHDDEDIHDLTNFYEQEVVVTEKMDGECTTIYPDGTCHARSTDSQHHPSRSMVKALASQIGHEIPVGWRVCGENMYAYHSVIYTDLPSYFLVYGIYNEHDHCLSWKDTVETCAMLGLSTVPVLYTGVWDEGLIRGLWTGKGRCPTFESKITQPEFPKDFEPCDAEGYVVRLASEFPRASFSTCVAKYVRAAHVQTNSHWMKKPVVPNKLISG